MAGQRLRGTDFAKIGCIVTRNGQAKRPGPMKQNKQGSPNWRELAFYSAIATLITVVNVTLTTLLFF